MNIQLFTVSHPNQGDYLVVSDLHGSHKQSDSLLEIAENRPPKMVFFLGDIIGTQTLADLQPLFYNGLINAAKKFLKENPNASDDQLLNLINPENGRNVLFGYEDLCTFLSFLDDRNYFSDQPAKHIREMTKYQHFGHWVSNLPKSIRKKLSQELEHNAVKTIAVMNQFARHGSQVIIIEGNWDARTPLDFYPTKDECIPIPPEKRDFYFKRTLQKCGDSRIKYFDESSIIETDKNIFVILPFDSAIKGQVPSFESKDKKIILVSHAQACWQAVKGDTAMTGEGQTIEKNMSDIIGHIKPDLIIHGHLHQTLRDNADGYILDSKTPVHYLPIDTHRFINITP